MDAKTTLLDKDAVIQALPDHPAIKAILFNASLAAEAKA